jgi:hypothetical protein
MSVHCELWRRALTPAILLVKALFDNWRMSGFVTFVTGAPMGVGFSTTDGADLTGGGDGQRITVLKNPVPPKSGRAFHGFFDTSAFARQGLGQMGTVSRIVSLVQGRTTGI